MSTILVKQRSGHWNRPDAAVQDDLSHPHHHPAASMEIAQRLIATFFCFLLLSSTAWAQPVTRSFKASAGGTLKLKLEAGGNVRIVGGGSEVGVDINRSGRDADKVAIAFEESASGVLVKSGYSDNGRHRADVAYVFTVPPSYNVELQLSGGDVTIEGVSGSLSGQTMGGALTLSRLGGTIDLQTMGGAVKLTSSTVSGRVHTMGGAIRLTDVQGDVEATTMGGDVAFSNVRPKGNSEMRVNTMGGNITVEDAPAGADVHTMGGTISVGQVGKFLRAETMGGDVRVDGVDGWMELKTMGGNVTATMTGGSSGDRHVEITSMGGDVELTLPDGLSADFDIEIMVEGRGTSPDKYAITGDFPMDVSLGSGTSARTVIRGKSKTAGGSNPVKIRTVNGDVRVVKGR